MKVNITEATGSTLDFIVAKCEGVDLTTAWPLVRTKPKAEPEHLILLPGGKTVPTYSTDPALAHPIIERERISVRFFDNEPEPMAYAPLGDRQHSPWFVGPTALIAAMRCYAATKLGIEVEVPDSLITMQKLQDEHERCRKAFMQDPTPRLGAALKQIEKAIAAERKAVKK